MWNSNISHHSNIIKMASNPFYIICIVTMLSSCDFAPIYPTELPKQKTMTEIESELYGDPDDVKSWGEINGS